MYAPSPLSVLQIPASVRLLPSACCPDKDLVILISRLGGRDRLGLWNYAHGTKVWEVDICSTDDAAVTDIVGLAWSPDGQTIVVAHHPPQITLHSLRDGTKRLTLPINADFEPGSQAYQIEGVWWYRDETFVRTTSIPDIFKRGGVIAGTSHAVLQTLPLLDTLQDDSQRLTVTDIFAFQGSQTKLNPQLSFPSIIDEWATLPPDPFRASINTPLPDRTEEFINSEPDNANSNSILAVSDNRGYIHYYLDGSYPLGKIYMGRDLIVKSLFKHHKRTLFLAYPSARVEEPVTPITSLQHTVIDIALLGKRYPRDMAKLSSTVRELMWYSMRATKEMRVTWFGSEACGGVRDLGPKWIEALESKQAGQFGQNEPNAILDLTLLLATGKATDSLLDFLGSGDQMSERGIQKWESTMTEALVKLREYSEKRVAPACQRVHIVLEELQGWAQLSQFSLFELSLSDINLCINLTRQVIVLSAWLAASARRELARFREFIHWLRFETATANPANENAPHPRHDILEVNNYLTSGLLTSSIDQWFVGPIPNFSLVDLGITEGDGSILNVLERASALARDAPRMMWSTVCTNLSQLPPTSLLDRLMWSLQLPQNGVNLRDRNIDALIDELAIRCKHVFHGATGATSRSAMKWAGPDSAAGLVSGTRLTDSLGPMSVRESTISSMKSGEVVQYLAASLPQEEKSLICIARVRYIDEALESPSEVGIALLEPFLHMGSAGTLVHLDLLDADFLDNECVVIIFRARNEYGMTQIATMKYNDLQYQVVQHGSHAKVLTREDLMLEAVERWKQSNLCAIRKPIKRARALMGCKTGSVSLALNGRIGRRVACVLDCVGMTLESFDVEGDGAEEASDGERT